MKRAWIGIAVLSASWLCGLSYYHQANWLAWAVLVAAGVALMIGAVDRVPGRAAAIAAIVLLLPVVFLARWPYRAGPLLMIVGLALQALPAPRRWPRKLGSAAVVVGIVLLAQSLTMEAYAALTARSHELPLPQMLGAVAKLLGMDVAVNGTDLVLFSMRRKNAIGATWELLVDPASVCFLVGAAVLMLLRASASPDADQPAGRRARSAGALLIAILLWLTVRAGLVLAVYLHRVLRTEYDGELDLMNQFWSTWLHLLLLGGPVLLAWRFYRPSTAAEGSAAEGLDGSKWRPCAVVAASGLAAAALTVSVLWQPSGPRKKGRVLVDEWRSQLPWPAKQFDTTRTDKPFDTTWYGHASGYNYASIYDYCSRFYEMSRLPGRIDDDALRRCDVLLLKVPSGAYTPQEVAAIRRFVERGGGLLLFGEHTSVYGSGVNLNRIARTFGFEYRYDCLFGVDSVFEQQYRTPMVPHPVVQSFPWMNFAISCSIAPFGPGRAVIRDTGLKNLGAYYHATNYYPPAKNQPQMRYGSFVQVWATPHGAGRVVGFTDSTIFANFSAFEPGKSELLLGMLEWLNHRNAQGSSNRWLLIAGLVLAAAAAVLTLGRGGNWPLAVAAGVCGWSLAAGGVRAAHRDAMPLPKPLRPMVRVALDRTVSEGRLPRNGFISGKKDMFGLFERNLLRLGYFTNRSAGENVVASDLVIVLRPARSVSDEFRQRLVDYVAGGGRLLVLDSPENAKSTANSLLHPFGLEMKRYSPLPGGVLTVRSGFQAIPVKTAREVSGGVPLAHLRGRPVAAVARHGKGSVTAIGFGSAFTDSNMGIVGDVIPNDRLKKLYAFQFALLRSIVEDKLTATAPARGK